MDHKLKRRNSKHLAVFLFPFRKKSWYEPLRRKFWTAPDRLMASKATIAIAMLAVPFVLLGKPFFAVTLGLGALAGALSETDDHPKGRIKSLLLKVISFGISSLAVELLRPFPVLLDIGLGISTVGFLIIGGLSERFRGVTYGAILVGIYAMIGAGISPAWYWQPILLPGGALFYGIFSLILLHSHPWRLLDEQLAKGYQSLAVYLEEKAKLFPSDKKMQAEIRNRLALKNVQLVAALDRCKDVINSYADVLNDHTPLQPYLRYFMLLQSLHERAASSHERYDLLSKDPNNRILMEGAGETLKQLGSACRKLARSLLINIPYRHPVALDWLLKVLKDQLEQYHTDQSNPLAMLINNLDSSNRSLKNLTDDQQRTPVPRLAKDTRTWKQRFKDQINLNNPRLRYAIRLSICFMVSFIVSEFFSVTKGEWIILTCLFVCQPSYSETRKRLFQRILGTLSGVILGVLIVQFLTPSGQLLLFLAAAYLFFIWMKKNYSISVIFITIFVLCAFNLISNQGVAVMLPRLQDTLIGALITYLGVRFLWPDWQQKRLPGLLATALNKNAEYFEAIIHEYQEPHQEDDLSYRIARREAHRADNTLVLAWQNMQMEPRKRKQFIKGAFALTFLNHALLSYLSALGAHRHKQANPIVLRYARRISAMLKDDPSADKEFFSKLQLLLKDLQQESQAANPSEPDNYIRQQFILLYNIAHVTEQIAQQRTNS